MARKLPPLSGLSFGRNITQRNVSFDITFEPTVGIMARRVDKLGLDIRSFKEPLKKSVKEVMIPSIRKNFDAGGRPSWAALTPETLQRKSTGQTLVESGALRRTMGQINIWDINRDRALIADLPGSVHYGVFHQAGYSARSGGGGPALSYLGRSLGSGGGGGGNVPARPFVMIHPEDERKIISIFRHWLDARVRKAGF